MCFSRHVIQLQGGLPEKCVEILRTGGVLVYPTETYYALGCSANNAIAVEAIFTVKSRPGNKALPLLAANMEQAVQAADFSAYPEAFLKRFWPGPLTVLAPGRNVPGALLNAQGQLAIRVSSHVPARQLAAASAFPLVATSANIAGREPVSNARDLDKLLLARLARLELPWAILAEAECKESRQPSTIVAPQKATTGEFAVQILREGAISALALAGWRRC